MCYEEKINRLRKRKIQMHNTVTDARTIQADGGDRRSKSEVIGVSGGGERSEFYE